MISSPGAASPCCCATAAALHKLANAAMLTPDFNDLTAERPA